MDKDVQRFWESMDGGVLKPFYEQKVVERARQREAQITPEEREQRQRERIIEQKWDFLRTYAELKRMEHRNDSEYLTATRDVLNAMRRLERGEQV